MDVPTLMHNLKEEVTCSVCIHLYEEPKQLPCLHIFCLECLNDLARTSTRHGKIKCPLCQVEVAVPESGSMETLPDCFYLKNLLDILAIKECNTSKVTCGNCDQKSEDASYCFNCGKFWCKDCINAHNILRENKEHRVLAIKDFQEEDFQDVLKRPAFCPKELHERGVFKFYCKECEVPACQTCVTLEHNKHDVEHLEIATRAVKDSLATQLDAAKKSCQTMSIYIRELEEQTRITEHRSQIVKDQIQQTVHTMISALQQQERKLVTEVENQTKETIEKFAKDKAKIQDQLKLREKIVTQVERQLERSSGAELVGAKSSLNDLFLELPPTPAVLASSCEGRSLATAFFENQALLHNLQTSGIGRLDKSAVQAIHCTVELINEAIAELETRLELITRRLDEEQRYFTCFAADSVTVKVASVQNGTLAGDVQVKSRSNGRYEVSCVPKQAGEHEIAVVINGQEFSECPKITVTKRSFKPVGFLKLGSIDHLSLNHPWGLATNDSNEIFLSDMGNERILVLNEKGEFIRSFGQHVSYPTGLICDNRGRIFVSSRGNNKILLFNQNGEYVSTLNEPGSLSEPRGISLDSEGNVIVCDAGSKCLRIFSPNGNILTTIGKGWLSKPMGCLCYEGKIFVSDSEIHVIKVYNSRGKFLYEFGKYGSKDGDLNEPHCLAVDKKGHLLVCCAGSHTVQVFTVDGTFVTKFGEHGKELGQFNRPCSTLVLKSGCIVVSEFRNNRLQMFE